jgi:hypothetical protein
MRDVGAAQFGKHERLEILPTQFLARIADHRL